MTDRASGVDGTGEAETPRWGGLEFLVLVQWLSSALLLIPGAQALRTPIRALPYVVSLALLALALGRAGSLPILPRWSRFLVAALLLLTVQLLHPLTNLSSGVAQLLLQLSIAAPAFWVASEMRGRRHLDRLVWLFFLAAATNAGVGILQVYYPATFMPPEFSALALEANPDSVAALTYAGADGREIIRPPGLSDYPGGASVAGMMTGLLGIVLASQRRLATSRRLFCLALAIVGLATLYLTQVRSLLMMMVASVAVMSLLLFRQRRTREGAAVIVVGVALTVVAFFWATAVGGESVSARFLELLETGPVTSFERNRGGFVSQTVREMLLQYPMGAGLGRWGMMYVHFAGAGGSDPIHVEIQLTGWLLDGGVLMWIFYGAALMLAMRVLYLIAIRTRDRELGYEAALAFCICFIVIGQSLAGPSFNTVLGMQFWLLVSAVFGVARHQRTERREAASSIPGDGFARVTLPQ